MSQLFDTSKSMTREQLEDLWRARLQDAKGQYDVSVQIAKEATELWNQRVFPPTDGSVNLRKALQAENLARREYMRVLQMFTELILRGKIPEEVPSRVETAI